MAEIDIWSLTSAKVVFFCLFAIITFVSIWVGLAESNLWTLAVIIVSWMLYFVIIDDIKLTRENRALKKELELLKKK